VKNIEERIKTMLRPGKKFYTHPSLPAATIIVFLALSAVPTTLVLTAKADVDRVFANPANLGPIVNSLVGEWDPYVTGDGRSLYFLSNRPGGLGGQDIWLTTRQTKDDPWGIPVNLGAPINSPAFEGAPCVSTDGLELYFMSNRAGGCGKHDLWVSKRATNSSSWGMPVNLGPKVNSAGSENNPSISTDGLSLYFCSPIWGTDRHGSLGGTDIWVTTRKTKNDPWSEAVNLGSPVNSPTGDFSPCISADGLSLYFGSTRSPGFGDADIWITTRKTKDDPWGSPVNLGPIVNTLHGDRNPYISRDGSILYFVSPRPDNPAGSSHSVDIWQAILTKNTPVFSLQFAAFAGDVAKVKALLNTVADMNERNAADMTTALQAAISGGHKEVVELLLTSDVDVKAPDQIGMTPLELAAQKGNNSIVELLLDRGTGDDTESRNGALIWAVYEGHKDVVELLIKSGADVNAKGGQGNRTPLDLANQRNHTAIAELLKKHGAKE
jgi:hypothetical protein